MDDAGDNGRTALKMNQSSVFAGALIGGFVLYLAMQKRLGAYWSLIMGGSGATAPSTGTGSVISSSGIANQAAGSQGTAGIPAVVGQSGSPAYVPTPNTAGNLITGNWYAPAQFTSQGTLTPAGSAAAAAQGAGIGMM